MKTPHELLAAIGKYFFGISTFLFATTFTLSAQILTTYSSTSANAAADQAYKTVKLSSFTALQKEGTGVQLTWTTTDQPNIAGFEIEVSADGFAFEKVGALEAGKATYRFLHDSRTAQPGYYRLRILDRDGSFVYSDVQRARKDDAVSCFLYPNPAKDLFFVEGDGLKEAKFFNAAGKLLLQKELKTGLNVIQLNTLPAETLLVSIYGVKGGSYSEKLVIQR